MADHTDPDLIPHLDHLILLVNDPHTASQALGSYLDQAISVFSELGFIVIRGGRHADGLTSNALIVFNDGIYIELIQFEKGPPNSSSGGGKDESIEEFEARRKKHWWYHCKPGWIDWSLLGGVKDGRVDQINQAAKMVREQAVQSLNLAAQATPNPDRGPLQDSIPTILYDPPNRGGRLTTDGKNIQWNVTFPAAPGFREESTGLELGLSRSAAPFWCEDLTPRDWRG